MLNSRFRWLGVIFPDRVNTLPDSVRPFCLFKKNFAQVPCAKRKKWQPALWVAFGEQALYMSVLS
jgi:hypothetical protein